MRTTDKTTFAGLTRLDPDDPISADNSSFQAVNPAIEDKLLWLGAVGHRHDAHANLDDPETAPSATVVSSGGAIDGDQVFTIGYTALDSDEGETTVSDAVTISIPGGYTPPETELGGSAGYASGNLLNGTYFYEITLLDGQGGETSPGPWIEIEREPGPSSASIALSNLSTDFSVDGAVGWRLYRAIGGNPFALLAEGTADTYTDQGLEAGDPSQVPPDEWNATTGNVNSLILVVPSGGLGVPSGATAFNVYLTPDGDFAGGTFIGRYPISSGGRDILLRDVDLGTGSPPDISRSYDGAHKIDPDTEILDWHWKRPVETPADLEVVGAEDGDVRLVLEGMTPYGFDADQNAWINVGGGTGGSGSGTIAFTDRDGPYFQAQGAKFLGSGATSVGVVNSPAGSATVTIYTAPDSVDDISVGEVGKSQFTHKQNLQFTASGGTGVLVSDLGGGSASVLISGGGGGSTPDTIDDIAVGEVGGTQFHHKGDLQFTGSGGTGVLVTDLGGGSASVTISGGTGGGGAADTIDDIAVGELNQTQLHHKGDIQFTSSGGAGVSVTDLGGGSAKVLIAAPGSSGGSSSRILEVFENQTGASATGSTFDLQQPGDKVSWSQVGSGFVEISFEVFTKGIGGSGSFTIYVDGSPLKDIASTLKEVSISNGGVGSRKYASPGNASTQPEIGSDSLPTSWPDASVPLYGNQWQVWMGPGAHSVEMRYRANGTSVSINRRRLMVQHPQ